MPVSPMTIHVTQRSWLRLMMLAMSVFTCVLFISAQQNNSMQNPPTKPDRWSGYLVSSACNADEAFNESPECFKTVPGAKIALYDDTNRVMYALDPQEKVSAHLGEAVTATGTLDGETIRLASLAPMAIGLAVGEKAPAFSIADQFGHVQTLDSLKGSNGTVLLFFRSADW